MKFFCWLRWFFHVGDCGKCYDCGRCTYHGAACKNVKPDYEKLRQMLMAADIYDEDGLEK